MKAIPSTAVPVEIEAEQNNLRRVLYWAMVLHTIPRQPQLATFMGTNVENKSICFPIYFEPQDALCVPCSGGSAEKFDSGCGQLAM